MNLIVTGPHHPKSLTPMPQPTDDISRALAYALDPGLWARDVVGWTPDPWQERLLQSAATQLVLCCGRQVGKSTVVAQLACHTAVFSDDALIILIAPSLRQSRELAIKVGSLLASIEPHEKLEEANKLSIRLARTGSRIVALPGHDPKTIRGFSAPRLIVVDEAAFALDETYAALVPMLAASPEGRIALLSTPFLQQGFFYDVWHGSGNWERYEVPSRDCPRISAAWLEERRREDPLKFAREYECSWSASADCLFSDELLDRITRNDYELFPAS
jgi:Terminase large subunit, T4likevirus-type, N-terminal